MTYQAYARPFSKQLQLYATARCPQQTLERAFASPKPRKRISPLEHRTPNHNTKRCLLAGELAGIQASASDSIELAIKHTPGCPMKTQRLRSITAGKHHYQIRNPITNLPIF